MLHTQLHAETLARSHLKYVLTRELDTPVTYLIRDSHMTNNSSTQNPPKKSRHRNATIPHNDFPHSKHAPHVHVKLNIQPPLTPRTIHLRRKTRKTHAQLSNSHQLNIFQCKAWNPSPTTHGLNPTPDNTTPHP